MKKENKKEISCSLIEAYLKGGIFSIILCSPFILLYILLYKNYLTEDLIRLDNHLNYASIILTIIVGIIIHEIVHGLTWAISSKKNISNIKLGIDFKSLTPYCHFKIAIKKTAYILGTIMPFIVLGLSPLVYGVITQKIIFLFWGVLFTFAASGDFTCIWKIRKLNKHQLILDHPDKIGCIIQ